MNQTAFKRNHWLARALAAACLCSCLTLHAQFPGSPFAGAPGGSSRSRSGASTRTYPNNGTVGDAIFSIDPETRNLIVIADDETAQYISQVVSNLDKPKPQVLIKVVFLEVTHNNSSDIGLEGGWGRNIGNGMTGAVAHAFGMSGINSAVGGSNSASLNQFGQPVQAFGTVPPGAGLYQIFAQDFQVTLRAIAQAGRAKILSRPSIIARNNQPATITVGQSVPLITNVRFDTFGNAINSVTYTDVGIILKVTPFITGDGMVEMIVSPETSDLVADRSQWVPISSGSAGAVSAPLINQRSADTVVSTPDGQTVIIGGLMASAKATSESKIPILGDIPLLGNLFKRRTKSDLSTELLIFLTPQIIPAPGEMAALTAAEQQKAGVRKSFSDQELEKFLDKLPPKETDAVPPGKSDRDKR